MHLSGNTQHTTDNQVWSLLLLTSSKLHTHSLLLYNNYHECSNLKLHPFTIPQFCRSEVPAGSTEFSDQGLTKLGSRCWPGRVLTWRQIHFQAHVWACGPSSVPVAIGLDVSFPWLAAKAPWLLEAPVFLTTWPTLLQQEAWGSAWSLWLQLWP